MTGDRYRYEIVFYPDGQVHEESAGDGYFDCGTVHLHNGCSPMAHYPQAIGGASVYVDALNSAKAVDMARVILSNFLSNTKNRPSRGLLENNAPHALEAWGYK